MNNKSKKSSFLKNLLTTASIASVIVGGSNTAFGASTRITNANNVAVNDGVGAYWHDNAGNAAGPVDGQSIKFGGAHTIDVNKVLNTRAIDANGNNGTLTINENFTVGSIVDVGAGGGLVDFNFGNGHSITLTGTEATVAGGHAFDAPANTYGALGTIDFTAGNDHILNITPVTPADIEFTNFKVKVANGVHAILNINNTNKAITFKHSEVATAREINISDGSAVQFSSTVTAGAAANTLNLQQGANDIISFGNTGKGGLFLTSNNAARNFQVKNGSLGGAKDGHGIIHLNAGVVGNVTLSADGNTVIGRGKDRRAGKFIITAPARIVTIGKAVYTKELELNGGGMTFQGEVYVGDQGVINIKADNTAVTLNDSSNLGKTDFASKAGCTITVAAGKTLEGEFYGNRNDAGVAGKIIFQGGGELKGIVNNLTAIQNTVAGTVTLSGKHATEIQGAAANTHFKFADGYKLTGDINKTAAAVNAASNLTFMGNAEITGTIGVFGAATVGDITILKDKTVTVGGDTIKAASILNNADGGTLKLTNNAGDVTITSAQISANGGGIIDATAMKKGSVLNFAGTIGTDPAVNNSKALGKLVLKGQDTNFNLAANPWVNIAGIDFGGGASAVKMNVAAARYAFGALTNAEESTFEVSDTVDLHNTITSEKGLKEIKFTVNDNKTLILHKGNDITARSITAFDGAIGSHLLFAGNATLKGEIGTSGKKFGHLAVNDGVVAITSGQGFFNEDIMLLGVESTLVVDNNYTVNAVQAQVDGGGILKFVNAAGTSIKLNTTAAADFAFKSIATVELNGGNVELEGINGIRFGNVKFTSATAASLTLSPQMKLDGINVDSTFKTASGNSKDARPTVVLSAIDHTIDRANHIGNDKDHLVNLQFAGDNTLNVITPDFFAGVVTRTDNQGIVNFKPGSGKVYGIGSNGHNLKNATFEVNTENFGDTYVNQGIINDNVTYKTGGTVAGGLQVGNDKGGSVAEFKDGVILTATMTSTGADNKISFTNDATIAAKLGADNARFKTITFNGSKKAALNNAAMYSEVVNFGTEDIVITGDNNIISATSHVNGNMNLNSGKLIFQDNQNDVNSTWGSKTSITTTLTADRKLGSIEVNTPIEVSASVPVQAIIVNDEAPLEAEDREYKLIANGRNLRLGNDVRFGPLTGVKADQAYAQWTVQTKDDKDVYLVRSNNAATVAVTDVKDAGGDEKDQENAGLLGREALAAMTDIGRLKDPKARAEAIKRITNAENALVTEAVDHVNVGVANVVGARLAAVDQQKPVGSGSDDVAGESMGAWVMPYYNQAVQKGEGSAVGYKTKSVGGVLGFDALVTENLTIGAAVSIVKTDMKYKDYKFGEKTDINTVMLSIYGSQQLDKDFFVQGLVSLGSNKIKNSDPRKVPTTRNATGQQIAKASYDSLSYGGQVLFGYNAKVSDSVSLTPMAGVRYTGSSDEAYKETGTDNANKVVAKKTSNKVEAVLGTRFAVSVDTSGITLMPEAHAFVSQRLIGGLGKVNAKLDGMTTSFATRSDKSAKTLFNLGLGVTAKAGNMEYGAGYDAYLASKYVGHQGTLKVRVNF